METPDSNPFRALLPEDLRFVRQSYSFRLAVLFVLLLLSFFSSPEVFSPWSPLILVSLLLFLQRTGSLHEYAVFTAVIYVGTFFGYWSSCPLSATSMPAYMLFALVPTGAFILPVAVDRAVGPSRLRHLVFALIGTSYVVFASFLSPLGYLSTPFVASTTISPLPVVGYLLSPHGAVFALLFAASSLVGVAPGEFLNAKRVATITVVVWVVLAAAAQILSAVPIPHTLLRVNAVTGMGTPLSSFP
ncbi:hypothetical protein KIPB_011675, partial [Kipferlia bialata]|eukprot:g11675.t1